MRSIGILLSSEVVAKLMLFAGSIALARLYTPAEFGLLGAYLAIVSLGAVFANLALHRAIPLPRSNRTANTLVALALISAALFSFVALLLVLIALAAGLAGTDRSWHVVLLLVPPGILAWACYPIAQMWLTRTAAFGPLAKLKLEQAVGVTALQISFGFAGAGGAGLAIGDILSRTLALFHTSRPNTRGLLRLRAVTSPARLLAAMRRYRRFPILVVPTILLQTLPATILPLAILGGLGAEAAGHWHLMSQVMLAVIAISVALTPYFLHRWARAAQRPEGLRMRDLTIPLGFLTGLAVGPCAMLYLWPEEIFRIIFGPDWVPSGTLIGILAPAMLVQFVGGPLIVILNVIGCERQNIALSALWGLGTLVLSVFVAGGSLQLAEIAQIQAWILGMVYGSYTFIIYVNLSVGRRLAAA